MLLCCCCPLSGENKQTHTHKLYCPHNLTKRSPFSAPFSPSSPSTTPLPAPYLLSAVVYSISSSISSSQFLSVHLATKQQTDGQALYSAELCLACRQIMLRRLAMMGILFNQSCYPPASPQTPTVLVLTCVYTLPDPSCLEECKHIIHSCYKCRHSRQHSRQECKTNYLSFII